MIVAFCGKKGHGKNTAADVLINRFKFIRVSFAYPLKSWVSTMFNEEIENFDYLTFKEEKIKRTITFRQVLILIDCLSSHYLLSFKQKIKLFYKLWKRSFENYRQMLQYIGTDVCRKVIDDDIFLNIMLEKLKYHTGNIVVDDCRFENERRLLKNFNAIMILVQRTGLKEEKDGHSSENSLGNMNEYHYVITNNDTLANFELKILNVYDKSHGSRF